MATSTYESATLLSVKQVAGYLGISPRQVWKLLAMNRMPKPVRLGGSVRWRASDIATFVECGCDMQAFEKFSGEGGKKS